MLEIDGMDGDAQDRFFGVLSCKHGDNLSRQGAAQRRAGSGAEDGCVQDPAAFEVVNFPEGCGVGKAGSLKNRQMRILHQPGRRDEPLGLYAGPPEHLQPPGNQPFGFGDGKLVEFPFAGGVMVGHQPFDRPFGAMPGHMRPAVQADVVRLFAQPCAKPGMHVQRRPVVPVRHH